MSDDRFPITFFDTEIGTASGWDTYQDNGQMFYEFEPCEKFKSFFDPCTQICLDPFCGEGERTVVVYNGEQEIEKDWKEFLKLLLVAGE